MANTIFLWILWEQTLAAAARAGKVVGAYCTTTRKNRCGPVGVTVHGEGNPFVVQGPASEVASIRVPRGQVSFNSDPL